MIKTTDDENLALAESQPSVDALNARFYGQFPYPWRPMRFDYATDADLERAMLAQTIGDWSSACIPASPKIWVAGCGTNQAAITALRFRRGQVVGSDVSAESLKLCGQTAADLGLSNLELRRESIHDVRAYGEYDHIICTGVIHHNADPAAALMQLSRMLKPTGLLELMVYNRYQRIVNAAFQKAVRLMVGPSAQSDFTTQFAVARKIISDPPASNTLFSALGGFRHGSDTAMADALIQPVEYSYTVESLAAMARGCGLEMLTPCLNIFDMARNTLSWNLDFKDRLLQETYDALPDVDRWQVANLLLFDQSPMLWFYFQKQESERPRKSERQLCDEFLDGAFARVQTSRRHYRLDDNGRYRAGPDATPFPGTPSDPLAAAIHKAADGRSRMRDLFDHLDVAPTFRTVNALRLGLTTPSFPYLRCVAR